MRFCFVCLVFSILLISSCREEAKTTTPSKVDYKNIDAINKDSTINIIVEIPAGTTAKYELNKETLQLEMDSIDGKARYINYLGYPGNYGMIPKTLLAKDNGGDGDPLDVLLLGSTIERGAVSKCNVIGVLKLLDNGEQDDKIIAIPYSGKWARVTSIEDLDDLYPGAREIVAAFFSNYKGPGEMELVGWGDRSEAWSIINIAQDFSYYKKEVQKQSIY